MQHKFSVQQYKGEGGGGGEGYPDSISCTNFLKSHVSGILYTAFHASQTCKAKLQVSPCVWGFREILRFSQNERNFMGHVYFRRQITPCASSHIHRSCLSFSWIHLSHIHFYLNLMPHINPLPTLRHFAKSSFQNGLVCKNLLSLWTT